MRIDDFPEAVGECQHFFAIGDDFFHWAFLEQRWGLYLLSG
jgi:hypothetical protein